MKVDSTNLLPVAKRVLTQMGITDYKGVQITYAAKVGKVWNVNFSYNVQADWFARESCFTVDALTGEILGMWKDRVWK